MTLGFLGFGLRQETDTQCNALALNKLGSRLLPCGDAASWLEFAGFLVVFGHSWRQENTLQRSGPHQDGLKTFALWRNLILTVSLWIYSYVLVDIAGHKAQI